MIRTSLLAAPLLLALAAAPSLALAQAAPIPVEDRLAIEEIVARMNHLIDAEDYDAYLEIYAENAVFDSGFAEPTTGRAPIRAFLDANNASGFIVGKRHAVTNLILDREGDRIVATYYLTVLEREETPGVVATAVIRDEFEERDGAWLVVRHVTRVDPALMNATGAQ